MGHFFLSRFFQTTFSFIYFQIAVKKYQQSLTEIFLFLLIFSKFLHKDIPFRTNSKKLIIFWLIIKRHNIWNLLTITYSWFKRRSSYLYSSLIHCVSGTDCWLLIQILALNFSISFKIHLSHGLLAWSACSPKYW